MYVSREVVEIGGWVLTWRGHRVTLSEFIHELVDETTRWPRHDDASTFADVLARLGDDGTK